MLTDNELKHGFIDHDGKSNPAKQHLFCITALRKMQEFMYETLPDEQTGEGGLTEDQVIDGLVDYLDAILGQYEGAELLTVKKDK